MGSLILICVALTSAALIYVFYPLVLRTSRGLDLETSNGVTLLKRLLRKKETIYDNIKDLEFEYKMGKLSDEDFQRLRNDLSREAYEVIARIDAIEPEPLQKPGQPQVVAVLKSEKPPKS
jgi:hypothetical protein